VVVNGCVAPVEGLRAEMIAGSEQSLVPGDADPALLADAARVRLDLEARQQDQCDRLARLLPLPQIRLPFLFTAGIGVAEIDTLADAFTAGVDTLAPV